MVVFFYKKFYRKDTELLCTHLYYFFPVSFHYLQCIHCLLCYGCLWLRFGPCECNTNIFGYQTTVVSRPPLPKTFIFFIFTILQFLNYIATECKLDTSFLDNPKHLVSCNTTADFGYQTSLLTRSPLPCFSNLEFLSFLKLPFIKQFLGKYVTSFLGRHKVMNKSKKIQNFKFFGTIQKLAILTLILISFKISQ